MKAGSSKPAHKKMVAVTRGARKAGSPGLLRSDPSVCVREAPVAVSTTATKANSQPQGAPGKGSGSGSGGGSGAHTEK